MYSSSIVYKDRETKAKYVYDKYGPLLSGSVLDVGADAQYVRPYVENKGGSYIGIGFGDQLDKKINLDSGPLPFSDTSYDTVMCLDVLEHLENIHYVFDELCRVARHYVIISLPNPYGSLVQRLRRGGYSSLNHLKFYGLPVEPQADRHRWFFNNKEAKEFIKHNASKNGFVVKQMDNIKKERKTFSGKLKEKVRDYVLGKVFSPEINELELFHGTLWCVLERGESTK